MTVALGPPFPAVASGMADCDEALAAMDAADPDLDPVWGLLLGDGGGERSDEEAELPTPACPPCSAAPVDSHSARAAEADYDDEKDEGVRDASAVPPPKSKRLSAVVDKAEVRPEHFALPAELSLQVTRTNVEGCDAYYLDNVLSPEECRYLVDRANGLWSFWDDSDRPRVEFRNACTIEVTHQDLADRIWRRVAPFVNAEVQMREDDDRFEVDIEGTWCPYGMNPTLLLGRYLDGGHFAPHTDGTTIVDFNRRTFYSCVLFLSTSPWGGHTRIYSDEQIRKELVKDEEGRLTGDPSLVLEAVPPVPGRMLVFYHRLMHEGVPAAEKYIIRSDVLYRRTPEICTAEEDVEAFDMYQEAQLLAEQGDPDGSVRLYRRAFKRSPALAKVYKM